MATVPGFAFVSDAGNGVAVLNTSQPVPSLMWTAPLKHAQGEALTPDGHYLLVTGGSGITVFRVSSLEQAARATPVGSLTSPGQKHAEDVAVTPDGQYAFVTYQNSAHVGVFDLQRALHVRFRVRRPGRAHPGGPPADRDRDGPGREARLRGQRPGPRRQPGGRRAERHRRATGGAAPGSAAR